MSEKNISISRIAELTGKDRRTVTKRLAILRPVETTKGAKKYEASEALKCVFAPDIEDEIRLKISAESTPDHAGGYDGTVDDNRIKRAKAEKLELELSERKGELIAVDQIVREVEKEYEFVRTNLLTVPSKAAKTLSTIEDPAEVERELQFYISEILKALTMDDPS